MFVVSSGDSSFTDFDFADDVAFLAELYEVLQSALIIFKEETTWTWLACKLAEDESSKLEWLWCIPMNLSIGLFNSGNFEETGSPQQRCTCFVLPVLLYGAETWAITKKDQLQLDVFGTTCLHLICGIRWSDVINNDEVYRWSAQIPICTIIRLRRLGLFSHIACLPEISEIRQLFINKCLLHGDVQGVDAGWHGWGWSSRTWAGLIWMWFRQFMWQKIVRCGEVWLRLVAMPPF